MSTSQYPWVWWNGRITRRQDVEIGVDDRSLLYGDGLFETLVISQFKPRQWETHWRRFQQSADALDFTLPFDELEIRSAASRLAKDLAIPDAVLRITLSRGSGPRGYSSAQATRPWILLSLHPKPEWHPGKPAIWGLHTSRWRLSSTDPLLGHKTANRLLHVLARTEAERHGAREALLLNENGVVVEASSANLFWVQNGQLFTPPLKSGAFPGITRHRLIRLAGHQGIPCRESTILPEDLPNVDAVFLTLTTHGLIGVGSIDNVAVRTPDILQDWHAELLRESSPVTD